MNSMNDYQELDFSENPEISARKKSNYKKLVIFIISLLALFGIGLGLCNIAIGYTAHSRYETLLCRAEIVYNASENWQEEGNRLETSSGNLRNAPFSKYVSDEGYYAIVCDEQGNLQYALYSVKKIKTLSQPDKEQEYRKLKNIFQRNSAVAVYPPEDKEFLD